MSTALPFFAKRSSRHNECLRRRTLNLARASVAFFVQVSFSVAISLTEKSSLSAAADLEGRVDERQHPVAAGRQATRTEPDIFVGVTVCATAIHPLLEGSHSAACGLWTFDLPGAQAGPNLALVPENDYIPAKTGRALIDN